MKTSVALCTYNGQKHIEEQLQSILNQTFFVDEIVICDDNSSDATANIIAQFSKIFPGIIRFYQNDINIGVNKNFEKAIDLCLGEYIFLCDQDDIWMKDKVEKTLQKFKENPLAEAIFSNAELIDDNGKPFSNESLWSSVSFFEDKLKKPIDLYFLIKHKSNMVTGATLCIKKTVKKFILPIPDSAYFFHDEWIAIILASRNTLVYTRESLISYRIHSNQQIGVGGSLNQKKLNKYWKLTKHILGYQAPKSFSDYTRLANNYFSNYKKYLRLANQSENQYPLNFSEIAQENLELFLKTEIQMQKINPFLYLLRKLKDKIKGKRQI